MANRNYGCRITEDIRLGDLQTVVMENEKLRLTIILDKGADIVELLYKPKDIDFMWHSPVELHNPAKYIPTTGSSLCNFLDHNEGGWQEILPNGGPECTYKGAILGMHGEISNIPWSYEIQNDCPEEISIKFLVQTVRSPFRLDKTITLRTGEPVIYFNEKLSNLAQEEMHLMWGHHPTIGEPFLNEHCEIRTSAMKVFTYGDSFDFETQRLAINSEFDWPLAIDRNGHEVDLSLIPSKEAKTADMLFLKTFEKEAFYEVYNKDLKVGFGMRWDKRIFPYVWMWQVCGGSYGYPWYGRTYNMALEPWTSYPGAGLEEAIKNETAMLIGTNDKVYSKMEVYITDDDI